MIAFHEPQEAFPHFRRTQPCFRGFLSHFLYVYPYRLCEMAKRLRSLSERFPSLSLFFCGTAHFFRKPALLLCDPAQPLLVQPCFFVLVPSPFRRDASLLSSLSARFRQRPLLLRVFPTIFSVDPPGFLGPANAFILLPACFLFFSTCLSPFVPAFHALTPLLGKRSLLLTRGKHV